MSDVSATKMAQEAVDVRQEVITDETQRKNLQYLAVHYHEALTFAVKNDVLMHNLAWGHFSTINPTATTNEIMAKVRDFENAVAKFRRKNA